MLHIYDYMYFVYLYTRISNPGYSSITYRIYTYQQSILVYRYIVLINSRRSQSRSRGWPVYMNCHVGRQYFINICRCCSLQVPQQFQQQKKTATRKKLQSANQYSEKQTAVCVSSRFRSEVRRGAECQWILLYVVLHIWYQVHQQYLVSYTYLVYMHVCVVQYVVKSSFYAERKARGSSRRRDGQTYYTHHDSRGLGAGMYEAYTEQEARIHCQQASKADSYATRSLELYSYEKATAKDINRKKSTQYETKVAAEFTAVVSRSILGWRPVHKKSSCTRCHECVRTHLYVKNVKNTFVLAIIWLLFGYFQSLKLRIY